MMIEQKDSYFLWIISSLDMDLLRFFRIIPMYIIKLYFGELPYHIQFNRSLATAQSDDFANFYLD